MRIFLNNPPIESTFEIVGDSYHYLKNVVRLKLDDPIEVIFDGKLYKCRLLEIKKNKIILSLQNFRELLGASYTFIVYQCLLKREYMDELVDKYTQLGVTKIVPVISSRSLPYLKPETLNRYRSISLSASLQSEQEFLTEISNSLEISTIEPSLSNNIVFYERGVNLSFPKLLGNSISIVIGPEGGFTENEINGLSSKGFVVSTPIKSILKANTAGIVFAGMISVLLQR